MIHLYLMLIVVAHILWLCAFVIYRTCAHSDEIWTILDRPFKTYSALRGFSHPTNRHRVF